MGQTSVQNSTVIHPLTNRTRRFDVAQSSLRAVRSTERQLLHNDEPRSCDVLSLSSDIGSYVQRVADLHQGASRKPERYSLHRHHCCPPCTAPPNGTYWAV